MGPLLIVVAAPGFDLFLSGRETKVHLVYLCLDYSSQYLVVVLPTERQRRSVNVTCGG